MLNVFMNTWGNYNENGADGGEWITLPLDEEYLCLVLDRIAEKMGDSDPEWFINDYEWVTEVDVRNISEHENIFELNEYVQTLNSMNIHTQEIYTAACEMWGWEYVDLDNLDSYILNTDIHNDYDLGYYWAHESGAYNLDEMSPLSNYIDYERFGRDIRFESNGGFTSLGWIEQC